MAGKRILDAVALLNASRNVAAKHIDVRLAQLDLYSRTSSLVNGFRSRADPTLRSTTQNFSQASVFSNASKQETDIPTSNSTVGSEAPRDREEGVKQDHFYNKSRQHGVVDTVPQGDLSIEQAKANRQPLPNGTTPQKGSPVGQDSGDPESYSERPVIEDDRHHLQENVQEESDLTVKSSNQPAMPDPNATGFGLSPDAARRAQRQPEDQIPATPADPSNGETFRPDVISENSPEFGVKQEQDAFYQPKGAASPVLSALPRIRLPKIEWDIQGGDPHIPNGINADVYYSGEKGQTLVSRDEPTDEMLSQMFTSPRVARLLGKKGSRGPVGGATRAFHTSALLGQKDTGPEAEELKRLGADLAKDANAPTDNQVVNKPQHKSFQMRESRVPSSQIGRLFEYGGLAASMAFGAVSESISRPGGQGGSLMLSPANMERLVAKLSKMRGAALKLGQMMSFQDAKLLPKAICDVLQRVQDRADYMPASQRNAVIQADLGPNWRDMFDMFDEMPMAAASIGQVHGAVYKPTGQRVAVKVQYPGVATSISSDLNNLSLLLTASRLLPKGLYLDKTIANARTELAWECDYIREADGARRFRKLLADDAEVFTVPAIVDEASGKQVLTMERMEGVAITKVQNFTQEQRDWIGTQILRLCLREIVEFRYMQTDPNWTNFLYNARTNKLELLDFGASREYPGKFITLYVKVLEAASIKDRESCRDLSVQLGYLTGYESKVMADVHVDSIMTLAEPFMDFAPDVYDFRDQTITDRVRELIPVMIRERLAPPPEETYSLHRKLSGAFLLCARLGSRVRCKDLFQNALAKANSF